MLFGIFFLFSACIHVNVCEQGRRTGPACTSRAQGSFKMATFLRSAGRPHWHHAASPNRVLFQIHSLLRTTFNIFLLCFSFVSGAFCNPEKAKILPGVLTPSSQARVQPAQQSHLELQQSARVETTPRCQPQPPHLSSSDLVLPLQWQTGTWRSFKYNLKHGA